MAKIKSTKEVLAVLSEQMDSLKPSAKPSTVGIGAARSTATLANSYVKVATMKMEYAKLTGEKPDLSEFGM